MDIPTNDDGFKWFGEGFDGFPKRLPDDCVEYIIYVIEEQQQRQNSIATTRSRLNQILKASNDLKRKLLSEYIWQREAFDLKLCPQAQAPSTADQTPKRSEDDPKRPHLKGRTNVGDSIADEWLVVYLLLELSKQHPDAWIRVYDTDGEFLLIEAANALPKWLNPDIAENRVWISNGHLRVIPLDEHQSNSRNMSAQDALAFISRSPDKLIISPFIEDEAFHRIRDYPSSIKSSLHHALLTIPRNLAYILHRNPSYVSPAIEAFYLRDPVALKPLATKDTSTLLFPPADFVTASVKFTKVGYAQLRSQVFDAPPAWTAVAPKLQAGDAKTEMGMKVACGMEMLLSDLQNKDKKDVREIKLLLEDVESSEETLPSDEEISKWTQTQDDEKWLDIDYNDFENELSGRKDANGEKSNTATGKGFGDANAQQNLRKMVSRFEDFLNDDTAGADGVDDDDLDDNESDASDTGSSDGEDKDASFDEAEFEKAMKEMMGMPPDELEKNGLLDEARKLALEDAEESQGGKDDWGEDEEMKKVMELMEQELKGHGALDLSGGMLRKKKTGPNSKPASKEQPKEKRTVHFGPERPPNMFAKKDDGAESADEEIGPGDGELSSDDEEFNDVDLGLAKNMLESFKGQAGMAGPAGNLMKAMGVNMPRDEGGDSD
ncbi:uncharacterized protein LTR77_003023 [Saxophila tyrrhenica]|uniref:SGT1-domain-containing protein n=1 Tax=Saxophila tyrrhenica TaxID=1690608 RepID=A0AAV9PGT2_9PEZI|nr:hypothetical protein LTR77_003023 [Saxophila tyrrhenica]